MKTLFITFILIGLYTINHAEAQRVTIDFDEYAAGVTLNNQLSLSSLGISFPNGIEVVNCLFDNGVCDAGVDGAFSGNNAGLAAYHDEFKRKIIKIRFEQRQDSVRLYLKPAYDYLTMQVSVEGWADGAEFPTGGSDVFINNSFRKFTLTNCDEIIIYGRSEGVSGTDNWLLIDDITFDKADDVVEDNTSPYTFISSPFGFVTFPTGIIPVSGYATDNVQLDSVEINVLDGSDVVYNLNFCGRTGVPCPTGSDNYEINTSLDLSSLGNGDYTLQIWAVDASGNDDTFERSFAIDIPPPPPTVSLKYFEVNQAVQNVLFPVDGPGTVRSAIGGNPLIPEKNTLVRCYLATTEGSRYNYDARLKATIVKEDGSFDIEFIEPNMTGFPDVDTITPLPSSAHDLALHYVDMRANLNKTLNFVIDEKLLVDANHIDLVLFEGSTPRSGMLQVNFKPPTEFGISYYKLKTTTVDTSVFIPNISDYIANTYPVSRVHSSYEGELLISLGFDLWAEIFNWGENSRMRRALSSALNGRYPTLSFTPEYNYWRVILGILDPGSGGNATIGDATSNHDRNNGVASTGSVGNVGAHEAGHLIGLTHAGKAHGECGGGGCETFVNVNGTLNGELGYKSDFGIALKPDGTTGNYNSFLIDPCPVSNPADRIGCMAGILETDPEPVRPFDLMSYGDPVTWPGFILSTRSKQWISSHNYNRIYNAIQNRISVKSTEKAEVITGVNTFIQIDGVIKDGEAYAYPLLEKLIHNQAIEDIGEIPGYYQVLLVDINEQQLSSRFFMPDSIVDTDDCCALSFSVLLPKRGNVNGIIIKDPTGAIIHESKASDNRPKISLLSDLAGMNFSDGKLTIKWKAEDLDDDPLLINIEYTPDLGISWYPLALLEEPTSTEIQVDISQLKQSNTGAVRLSVSDGIYTDADMNTESFCIRAEGTCQSEPINIEPENEPNSLFTSFAQQITVNLYPNPAKDQLNIFLEAAENGKVEFSVMDILGREYSLPAATFTIITGVNHLNLDTHDLPAGIYSLRIEMDSFTQIKQFIIQR